MDKEEKKEAKKEFSADAKFAQECIEAATELRKVLLPAKYVMPFFIQEFPELENNKSKHQYIRRFMQFANPDKDILEMVNKLITKYKKNK